VAPEDGDIPDLFTSSGGSASWLRGGNEGRCVGSQPRRPVPGVGSGRAGARVLPDRRRYRANDPGVHRRYARRYRLSLRRSDHGPGSDLRPLRPRTHGRDGPHRSGAGDGGA